MPRLISHHTSLRRSRTPRRRSESARLCAPRGGCCRFVMRSAGPSRQQTCDGRLGCGGIPTAGTLLAAMFVCFGMPNAVWRQCDVRATAKASDGMLLSGVPIPGCRSPLPLGPTFAFQIGLGLANRRRREGNWQPTSVTALGGILVGDGRVAAGVSELGPAMSDGESGFPANYSRPGPTIIRDYSRRPRRGRAHAPEYGGSAPGLSPRCEAG